MPVPSRITDISAVAGNNSPTGGEFVGSNMDNYLRGIQAAFRGDLAYVGANIATAATPDIGAIQGSYHLMTGNTTITGFVSGDPGVIKILEAQSTMPLIHSTTLPLLDGANMTLQPGESAGFVAKAGGVWKQLFVSRGSTIPSGAVMPYAGTSAPTGWLLCYGQAVSRSTYSALFTAISTTYGTGDGSTTFNLPDLRGRVVAGKDDMGGSSANRLTDSTTNAINGDVLGDTGGHEIHTLAVAEMPAHSHPGSYITIDQNVGALGAGNPATGNGANPQSLSLQIAAEGGSGNHNNVQPTIILNYIIKT